MGNLPAVFVQLLLHPTLQNLCHLCQLGSQGSKVCQLLYVTEQKNEIIRETLGLGKREQADRSSLLRLTSFTHSSRATARLQSRMFAVRSKMFQVQDLCIQGVRHWRRMTCFSLMYHRVCKYCTNIGSSTHTHDCNNLMYWVDVGHARDYTYICTYSTRVQIHVRNEPNASSVINRTTLPRQHCRLISGATAILI